MFLSLIAGLAGISLALLATLVVRIAWPGEFAARFAVVGPVFGVLVLGATVVWFATRTDPLAGIPQSPLRAPVSLVQGAEVSSDFTVSRRGTYWVRLRALDDPPPQQPPRPQTPDPTRRTGDEDANPTVLAWEVLRQGTSVARETWPWDPRWAVPDEAILGTFETVPDDAHRLVLRVERTIPALARAEVEIEFDPHARKNAWLRASLINLFTVLLAAGGGLPLVLGLGVAFSVRMDVQVPEDPRRGSGRT